MTDHLAALPDPAGLSDARLHTEITALIEVDARSARRWSCDRPGCDGLPHEGWLHHHARATQRAPRSEWTSWMLLTGRGWGKMLAVDTPIPTPTGWTLNGRLRVGDEVFDEAGRSCKVTAVFDAVPDRAYRLHFSDGTSIDACDEHQWVTWDAGARKALNRSARSAGHFPADWPAWRAPGRWGNGRSDSRGPRVVTTQEIVDTLTTGSRGDTNHAVPVCGSLHLPAAELPINPYVLGIWLGDGDSGAAIVTSADPEVPEALRNAGYELTLVEKRQGACPRWSIRGLRAALRELNLLRNKHVPPVYLRASAEQRLALLRGLMDADGYAERSKVEYCTTLRGLADAVVELARSLGQKPRVYEERARFSGTDCGPRWRVVWRPTTQVFSLPRKADRVEVAHGPQALRNHHRMIVRAEPIAPRPMRCISVDSPHRMYLAGEGMIPTHNTRTAAETVREWVTEPGKMVAVVAKNATLVKEICFESPKSGLLAVIPPEDIRRYSPGNGLTTLRLKNGSAVYGFGAETPDNLRGFAFDKGWLDEYAAWNRHTAQSVYDMLWFCLREAPTPQVVISTTPKPLPHVKRLVERGRRPGSSVVLTTGRTEDNRANLSAAALAELDAEYGGTRLGRQELDGVLLEDVEGALWKQWMFEVEGFRVARHAVPPLDRLVVAVDPAVTTTDSADLTAFAVAGRSYPLEQMYGDRRPRGYVLHTEQDRHTPTAAMRRAAALYHEHQADCVVIEANNGGDYLPALLAEVDPTVPCRVVHATRGKRARAAPVAMLYEQSRITHAGPPRTFAALEEQMTTYVGASDHEEKSPDLLDSCAWALTDLFLDASAPGAPTRSSDNRLGGRR